MNFQRQLNVGKIGESYIARWFQNRGYNILPVYQIEIHENKGPTLLTCNDIQLICPDMLVFKENKVFWIEAKHKTAFSWHRKTNKWVTGIDLRHYEDYKKVAMNLSGWPVYLMFLHKAGGIAKDTPDGMISPTGLYGGEIMYLSENENHRHDNWGKSGMVYWSTEVLKKFDDYNV
jgi:hypothetical protein